MNMKKQFFIYMLLVAALTACQQSPRVAVGELRCEGLDDPMGIDFAPRLSWQLESEARNVFQTGYHILVASTAEKLQAGEADLWDSGPVESDKSVNVRFGGNVTPRATYFWKVKAVTTLGETPWSKPAKWTAGLITSFEWKAQWTGLDASYPGDVLEGKTRLAARYFRKEFKVEPKRIEKATLYISGLGLYECTVNGNRLSNQTLSPTPTDYSKVVKYNTFDVTGIITGEHNAIGVALGNGRFFSMRQTGVRHFGFPKMILQLEIIYADGAVQTIMSDTSWKVTANGPIRSNNEFDGEEYDARMEMPGWDTAGFDDSAWEQAQAVEPPGGTLEGQVNPNIARMDFVRPAAIKELSPGTFIMDMGQNMVGRVAMQVQGAAGQEVKLRFAETLKDDGSLYLDNIRGALVTDKYTLSGKGLESWEPVFTYHGFRYVEISGYPGTPTVENFSGQVVYDQMEITGSFETSDATINQIYRNAYWGIRGNYRGMPTDCPQRDERMGWLGDRAVGSLGESFIFDNNNLYAKWLDDIEQAQREDGAVPDVAPNYWSVYTDNMTWPGAYIIIADMLYRQYDNIEPIAKHYASMKKWLHYMRDNYLKDGIMTKDTYGDWCMPPELPELIHSKDPARKTDGAVLSTTFYYRLLRLMEGFAGLLGKPDDVREFAGEADNIRQAFYDKYFNKEGAYFSNNTVTANLLALCYGMVPQEYVDKVFKNIVDKTLGEFNGHVSTGLVGIQWLMRGLSFYGRPDIAYRIATNRTYPSWGYMAEKGATTIWELWNGDTADPGMNSHNHVMLLGDLIVWYYENLAGIRNDPSGTGFKRIEMKPNAVEGLEWVNASYESVYGRIESSWKKEGGGFAWDITIPANSAALVYLPMEFGTVIRESGQEISAVKEIRSIGEVYGHFALEIGSGTYKFSVQDK
ncbi:MAG: glycoside hydrolase family 78 protein [Tannerellaceae bacterium]|jgi:alpha-L-rhamnosidase|nr:glycoside hydrolase family 78 protein [Tannerellaceae bacterium]